MKDGEKKIAVAVRSFSLCSKGGLDINEDIPIVQDITHPHSSLSFLSLNQIHTLLTYILIVCHNAWLCASCKAQEIRQEVQVRCSISK